MAKKILGKYVVKLPNGKSVVLAPNDVRIAVRRIRDDYLLATPQGNWIMTGPARMAEISKNKISPQLKELLEKRGLILNEKTADRIVKDTILRKSSVSGGPSLHIIVPTNRCNQKCAYCHASSVAADCPGEDMNIETARKAVEFIMQSRKKNITIEFQGGESTLNMSVLKDVVRYAKELNKEVGKNLKFVLATNLTNMTAELADYIYSERIIVSTSLDGPKDIHDSNRKMEGGDESYDTVVKWIAELRGRGVPVGALMVTTRKSLGREKDIIDEYVRLGMKFIQIKPISRLGFASDAWDKIGYDIEEFCKFYRNSMNYIVKLNSEGVEIKERHAEIALMKIMTKRDPNFTEMSSPCGAAVSQLSYAPNGDVYSCDEGRCFEEFKLGNVNDDSQQDVLSSKKTRNLVISSMLERKKSCMTCAYLAFCGTCPVLNHAVKGEMDADPAGTDRCIFHACVFDTVFAMLRNDETWRTMKMNEKLS